MHRRTLLKAGLAGTAALTLGSALPAAAAENGPMTAWLTHQDLQRIKSRITRGLAPTAPAWDELVVANRAADLDRAADKTPVEPLFFVGPYYETPPELLELSYRFRGDAHAAYRLALGHAVTSDRRLAVAARSLILRWRAIETFSPEKDTPLVWANQFPEFVWAAEILRRTSPVWSGADERSFRDLVSRGLSLDPSDRTNNWGSWGVVLRLTSAAYLGDAGLFATGIARWRELLESQFDARGWQPAEIGRNDDTGNRGICYSHFNLHPLTIAAQIARKNGTDLFSARNSQGAGLGEAFAVVMGWAADPETFSTDTGYWPEEYESIRENGAAPSYNYGYGEILDPLFPNADFRAWAGEDRPLSFNWTGSLLTLTHGRAW